LTETPDSPLILVADDDRDILDLVCFRLEMAGYRTVRARNGEEATRVARESAPDLCVLDVMMPKRTGFEVVQDLRADESTADIPVMLLTATVQDKDVARGFEYGADDYLKKPFDPQELRARVTALLRRPSRS
jgi:DNA-binding response OmpR family regulator